MTWLSAISLLLGLINKLIKRVDEKRVGDMAVARYRLDKLEAQYEDVWKATVAKRIAMERFDRVHNNRENIAPTEGEIGVPSVQRALSKHARHVED